MRTWYLALLAGSGLIGLMISVQPMSINHDVALYLECGRQLLQGKLPYVDFMDVNPPLIMYLSTVPVAIASALTIPVIAGLHLVVLMLAAASAGVSSHLLFRSGLGITPGTAGRAGLGILVYSALLFWTSPPAWGQREHLFLLAYLPLFYCRWIRWEQGHLGRALPPLIGFLAGIAACLKPHFVLLGLMVEGFHFNRCRRWRPFVAPEAVALVVAGAGYAAHFLLLPESVREGFFGHLLPMIREGYGAYESSAYEVLMRAGAWVVLLAALATLVGSRRGNDGRAALARAFAVASLGGLLLYLQQGKGWPYHLVPYIYTSWAGLMMTAGRAAERIGNRSPAGPRLAVWLLVGSVALGGTLKWGLGKRRNEQAQAERVLSELFSRTTRADDPILMLSTSVGKIYPLLLRTERSAGSRYLWTFPVAMLYASQPGAANGAYPYRPPTAMGEAERRFLRELSEDVERRHPRLILIDAGKKPQGCPAGFTLPDYFEAVGFITGAMGGYRYWNDVFGWKIYAPADTALPPIGAAEKG